MNKQKLSFWSTAFRLVGIGLLLLVTGCVGRNYMALKEQSGQLDTQGKSIGLFTLKTANVYKPRYQPVVEMIYIISEPSKERKRFFVDKAYNESKHQFYEYMISISLDPGKYKVVEVIGSSGTFPIHGWFAFPIDANFELKPRQIVYLGHVSMVNRERKEGETRSGSLIPLLDQSVSGFSASTFDISVIDRGEEDIAAFIRFYPSLKNISIDKAIMIK